MKAADTVGLNQSWLPAWDPKQGLSDIGSGMQKLVMGGGPEAHPRLAGAVQAAKGALDLTGAPSLMIGTALAPEVTLPALAAGNLAGHAAQSLTPSDWSPEVRQAIGLGTGLVAGGIAGQGMSRLKVSPPVETAIPKTGELARQAPEFDPNNMGPQRSNVNSVIREAPRELPPGKFTPPLHLHLRLLQWVLHHWI